jgi:cysteine-rich repeat protein
MVQRMIRFFLLLLILSSLFFINSALAQGRQMIAILNIDNFAGLGDPELNFIRERVQNAVIGLPGNYMLMSQENMQMMLPPGTDFNQCTEEASCEVDFGRMINAHYVVTGDVTQLGRRIILTLKLFDVRTGEIINVEEIQASNLEELFDQTPIQARRLFDTLLGVGADLNEETAAILVIENVTPSPVEVYINDTQLGTGPGRFQVLPGVVTIEIRYPGYEPYRQEVTLRSGQETTVKGVTLTDLPAFIDVMANVHHAEIVADGRVLGLTVLGESVRLETMAGTRNIIVQRIGFSSHTERLTLSPGATMRIDADLRVNNNPRWVGAQISGDVIEQISEISQASERRLIAVLDTQSDAGFQDSELVYFANNIRGNCRRLLPSDHFQVASRDNIDVLTTSTDFRNCQEASCDVEFGQQIGADYIVTSRIAHVAGRIRMNIRLFDVNTASPLSQEDISAPSVESLSDQLSLVTENLLSPIRPRSSGRGRQATIDDYAVLEVMDILPSDFTIHLGGQPVTNIGAGQYLVPPSRRSVDMWITHPDYIVHGQSIDLEAGEMTRVSGISLELSPAQLGISTNVDQVEIYVDDERIGGVHSSREVQIEVSPLARHLTVMSRGYVPFEEGLSLRPNGSHRINVEFERMPQLEVTSNVNGARLNVDGTMRGSLGHGAQTIEVDPGQHLLEVSHSEYRTFSEQVRINAGETQRIEAFLEQMVCGDDRVDPGEECDDGNLRDGDGCSSQCIYEAICGDGIVNRSLELCDDGNLRNGDGCNELCRREYSGIDVSFLYENMGFGLDLSPSDSTRHFSTEPANEPIGFSLGTRFLFFRDHKSGLALIGNLGGSQSSPELEIGDYGDVNGLTISIGAGAGYKLALGNELMGLGKNLYLIPGAVMSVNLSSYNLDDEIDWLDDDSGLIYPVEQLDFIYYTMNLGIILEADISPRFSLALGYQYCFPIMGTWSGDNTNFISEGVATGSGNPIEGDLEVSGAMSRITAGFTVSFLTAERARGNRNNSPAGGHPDPGGRSK